MAGLACSVGGRVGKKAERADELQGKERKMTLLREENRFCDEDEDCEGNEIMSGYKTRRSQGGGTVTQVPAVSDAPRREAIQLVRRLSCDHTFFHDSGTDQGLLHRLDYSVSQVLVPLATLALVSMSSKVENLQVLQVSTT